MCPVKPECPCLPIWGQALSEPGTKERAGQAQRADPVFNPDFACECVWHSSYSGRNSKGQFQHFDVASKPGRRQAVVAAPVRVCVRVHVCVHVCVCMYVHVYVTRVVHALFGGLGEHDLGRAVM